MLLEERLWKNAQNLNFANLESALYSKSGSMPLTEFVRYSPEAIWELVLNLVVGEKIVRTPSPLPIFHQFQTSRMPFLSISRIHTLLFLKLNSTCVHTVLISKLWAQSPPHICHISSARKIQDRPVGTNLVLVRWVRAKNLLSMKTKRAERLTAWGPGARLRAPGMV